MLASKNIRIAKPYILTWILLLLLNITVNATINPGEIRPKILRISAKLQQDNKVHFGYPVGIEGKLETGNKYYKLYKRLEAEATNEELVELTKNSSAVIVVYAFDILYSRKYKEIKNVFLNHADDSTWFSTAGGCTGFSNRINWFMLKLLKPTDIKNTTNFLTQVEYDFYCSRFKKEDTAFSCH